MDIISAKTKTTRQIMTTKTEIPVYFSCGDANDTIISNTINIEHNSTSDSYWIWFEDEHNNKVQSICINDNLEDIIDKLIELEYRYGYTKYVKVDTKKNTQSKIIDRADGVYV